MSGYKLLVACESSNKKGKSYGSKGKDFFKNNNKTVMTKRIEQNMCPIKK